jgi:hypothetical protein
MMAPLLRGAIGDEAFHRLDEELDGCPGRVVQPLMTDGEEFRPRP